MQVCSGDSHGSTARATSSWRSPQQRGRSELRDIEITARGPGSAQVGCPSPVRHPSRRSSACSGGQIRPIRGPGGRDPGAGAWGQFRLNQQGIEPGVAPTHRTKRSSRRSRAILPKPSPGRAVAVSGRSPYKSPHGVPLVWSASRPRPAQLSMEVPILESRQSSVSPSALESNQLASASAPFRSTAADDGRMCRNIGRERTHLADERILCGARDVAVRVGFLPGRLLARVRRPDRLALGASRPATRR